MGRQDPPPKPVKIQSSEHGNMSISQDTGRQTFGHHDINLNETYYFDLNQEFNNE